MVLTLKGQLAAMTIVVIHSEQSHHRHATKCNSRKSQITEHIDVLLSVQLRAIL